jgi:hypothetical protein
MSDGDYISLAAFRRGIKRHKRFRECRQSIEDDSREGCRLPLMGRLLKQSKTSFSATGVLPYEMFAMLHRL